MKVVPNLFVGFRQQFDARVRFGEEGNYREWDKRPACQKEANNQMEEKMNNQKGTLAYPEWVWCE
jgi:hypothetical protein